MSEIQKLYAQHKLLTEQLLAIPEPNCMASDYDKEQYTVAWFAIYDQLQPIISALLLARKRSRDQRLYLEAMRTQETQPTTIGKYCMLTINAAEGNAFKLFKDSVDPFFKQRTCKWAMWAYEQRSEVEGEYHGFHCHALFECADELTMDKLKQRLIYRFLKTGICGSMSAIHRMFRDDLDRVIGYSHYMRGNKKLSSKQTKVSNDKNFRRDKGIKPYYTFGTVPGPLLVDPALPPPDDENDYDSA